MHGELAASFFFRVHRASLLPPFFFFASLVRHGFCSLFTLSVLGAVVEARSLLPLLYGMLPGSHCIVSPTWGMVTGNPLLPQGYMMCLPELSVLPHSHGAMVSHPHGAMGSHPRARMHAHVLSHFNDPRSSRSTTNATAIAHSQNSNQRFEVQVFLINRTDSVQHTAAITPSYSVCFRFHHVLYFPT